MQGVEIARRIPFDTTMTSRLPAPSFLWETEDRRRTYEPRDITHWMALPARP